MWPAPSRWDPVIRDGEDLRVTFTLQGATETLEDMKAIIDGHTHPLTISAHGAQLLIPAAQAATLPDRAPTDILIKTAGTWTTITTGYIVNPKEMEAP